MNPRLNPILILYVKGIIIIIIKAGTKVFKSLKSKNCTFLNIYTPTIIRAGAVAYPGTTPTKGANTKDNTNRIAVTTDANPVLAPAAIPAEDSTKVVTVEVPITAPKIVDATSVYSIFPTPFRSEERRVGKECRSRW